MPRLEMLTPCQSVIIDKKTDMATFFNVLSDFKVSTQDELSLEKTKVLPREWTVFCTWRFSTEERGQDFEQQVEYVSPEGTVLVKGATPLQSVQRSFRSILNITGMPLTTTGEYEIRVSMRLAGREEWEHAGSLKIHIELERVA